MLLAIIRERGFIQHNMLIYRLVVINPGHMVHQGYRSRLVCVCSKSPLECLYEKRYDMAGSTDQTFVVFSENAPYSRYGACSILCGYGL